MQHISHPQMEERIARCRLVFSVLVVGAVMIDPLQPALNPWMTLLGGSHPMQPDFLSTVVLHSIYSLVAYLAVRFRATALERLTYATIS